MKPTTPAWILVALLAQGVAAGVPNMIDKTFGHEGITLTTHTFSDVRSAVRAMTVLPDDSILISGTLNPDGIRGIPYVVKFAANGVLDATFGNGGFFTLELDPVKYPFGARISALGTLGDGSIVFHGGVQSTEIHISSTTLVGMLTPQGNLHTGFAGGTGVKAFDFAMPIIQMAGFYHNGNIAIDSADRILVGGSPGAIVRLLANGELDTSYANNGVSVPLPGGVITHTVLDTKERAITLGVRQHPNGAELLVARTSGNGSLDTGFGIDGFATIDSTVQSADLPYSGSLQLDAQNRIVVGYGMLTPITASSMDVARLDPSGSLDTSFNPQGQQQGLAGIARIPAQPSDSSMSMAVPAPGDAILVIGATGDEDARSAIGLSRLLEDASNSPSVPGKTPSVMHVFPGQNNSDVPLVQAIDSKNRIIIAGITEGAAGRCLFLFRVISDRLFLDGADPDESAVACPK